MALLHSSRQTGCACCDVGNDLDISQQPHTGNPPAGPYHTTVWLWRSCSMECTPVHVHRRATLTVRHLRPATVYWIPSKMHLASLMCPTY